MSNSFELLQGSVADIQEKYEILSDIVSDIRGKVHGSQTDRDPKTGLIDLIVYYEVLEGKREKVKQRDLRMIFLQSTQVNTYSTLHISQELLPS
jgi:hypothetical protein